MLKGGLTFKSDPINPYMSQSLQKTTGSSTLVCVFALWHRANYSVVQRLQKCDKNRGRFTPTGCRDYRGSKALSSTAGRGQALWFMEAEILHGRTSQTGCYCCTQFCQLLQSMFRDKNRQNILKITHFLSCFLRAKILCVSSSVLHPFRGHCTKENE